MAAAFQMYKSSNAPDSDVKPNLLAFISLGLSLKYNDKAFFLVHFGEELHWTTNR